MVLTPDFAASSPSSPGRLNLYSLRRLEYLLGFDRAYFFALASLAGNHYNPFPKRDRPLPFPRKAKPTKQRTIDNPTQELKTIQSRINERLLKTCALPANILGGIQGKSVIDNAQLHRSSKVLVKIDIARFFPSITNNHVYYVWRHVLGCSPRISALLTRLTTFERHLPQGAPTSTSLANLVLYSIDRPIRGECARLGIQYSSLIDDLAFSSDNPRPIIGVVIATLRKSGFHVSRRKLTICGRRDRKVLNSIVLGTHGLGVLPDRLANIRSGIHKLRQGLVRSEELDSYVRSLRGRISNVATICPEKAARFRRKLDAVLRQIEI